MRTLLALATLCAAGCLPDPGTVFTCFSDRQCVSGTHGAGFCEATEACSFPDAGCPSGRRYGDQADAVLARRCVDGTLSTNLVGNSDFEDDLSGWVYSASTLSRADLGHSLDHSAQACGAAASWFGLTDDPSWVHAPKQGQVYRARAWVRAPPEQSSGQTAVVWIRERPTSTSLGLEQGSAPVTLTAEWQAISVTRTISQDVYALDLYLTSGPSSPAGCLLADDISLYLVR
jgi:hypothetical protein